MCYAIHWRQYEKVRQRTRQGPDRGMCHGGRIVRVAHTVFILGAGASAEVGLPVGESLTARIAELLDIRFDPSGRPVSGDGQIISAFHHHAGGRPPNPDPYRQAAHRIRAAMPLAASIDNFLDAHRTDTHIQLCGKLAIVRSILAAEHESKLYTSPHELLNPADISGSWFTYFWRLLCEGCTAEQLAGRARDVAFVSFNYDRCIEQFLFQAARVYYGLDANSAAAAIKNIQFFHPYGSVGVLSWTEPGGHVVEFGDELEPVRLLESSARIKTFTESAEGNAIADMRNVVNSASRIVFLGFAYHWQNLRLLWPERLQGGPSERRFLGTALKISPSDVAIIGNDISEYSGSSHYVNNYGDLLNDLTCADLFRHYNRTLSLIQRAVPLVGQRIQSAQGQIGTAGGVPA
jgi:hypothetical protein